ncbi:putative calcium-activated potassium channel subunit beta isoform X2 [Passer montanus]|uniref:putative calcium-activated potassium channel subunit beta isoform X2 n=1 Tax=Passer montanus TaxID=9160 RepID=UPI001960BB1A|nr:putative calcium-activated potassium channel subunit beta isoform X2 [Passer montanus]
MLGKKLVTAQKRGETRALCLGLGMVACSMMMYFFIGITIVPFYTKSVWTTETVCKVLKANIKDKVFCPNSKGSEDEEIFPYPCLQVWVNLTASGQEVMLYQTEDTLERNPKCSYVPEKLENSKEVKARIETIASNFKKYQTFPCYYDPGGTQTNAILSRLYPEKVLLSRSSKWGRGERSEQATRGLQCFRLRNTILKPQQVKYILINTASQSNHRRLHA